MKRPIDGPIQPGDSQPPRRLNRDALLNACVGMRESIRQGRQLVPPSTGVTFDWDEQERRIDEMERLLNKNDPVDDALLMQLNEDFRLYCEAEFARVTGPLEESLVRFTDDLAQRVEEKKFEMTSEQREGMEEVLMPYQDRFREEMLGRMPIETRRKLEEEKRRREEGEE
jgi:PAS domain-containing protein